MNKQVIKQENFQQFLDSIYYKEFCDDDDNFDAEFTELGKTFNSFIELVFDFWDVQTSYDSPYFHDSIELTTESYIFIFRRSSYIKDECICDPVCDEFEIYKIEEYSEALYQKEQLNFDKWRNLIFNSTKEELFDKICHNDFESMNITE